ncbi:MAG: N-methyl-L-tryptophan oxidase [Rhizomicrobium sp.]
MQPSGQLSAGIAPAPRITTPILPESLACGTKILKVKSYDAAILGLGALGSATLLALAARGIRVLGIDRLSPPHQFGSSHGGSRITRQAIGEGAHLTPLAMRSQTLWRDIEREAGAELFTVTGLLVISSAQRTGFTHVEGFFATTVEAAGTNGIAHELLDTAALRRRFPQFRIGDGEEAYFEPGGGVLRPEACVAAQIALARRAGAHVCTDEPVLRFVPRAHDVLIETPTQTWCANTLVLAAGPWLPELLAESLVPYFRIFRQVQFWFAPRADVFGPDRFPIFIWELRNRTQSLYGFPQIDEYGVKIATEQYRATTTAASADRRVDEAECRAMHEQYVAPFLPAISPHCLRASACLYTVTPDFGFIIDRHPDSDRIIIASCCSGHGFKHAPALGEAIAEMALDGTSRIDMRPFALARFARH